MLSTMSSQNVSGSQWCILPDDNYVSIINSTVIIRMLLCKSKASAYIFVEYVSPERIMSAFIKCIAIKL